MSKLDPIDIVSSVFTGYFSRVLLLFSAGWVGLTCGLLCQVGSISELLDFRDFLTEKSLTFAEGWWIIFGWPIMQVAFGFSVPFMTLITVSLTVAMFFSVVHQENDGGLWWIIMAMATSLLPVSDYSQWDFVGYWLSWTLLGLFWIGFLSLGWYFLQANHPDLIERFTEGNDDEYESISEIKDRLAEEEEETV